MLIDSDLGTSASDPFTDHKPARPMTLPLHRDTENIGMMALQDIFTINASKF